MYPSTMKIENSFYKKYDMNSEFDADSMRWITIVGLEDCDAYQDAVEIAETLAKRHDSVSVEKLNLQVDEFEQYLMTHVDSAGHTHNSSPVIFIQVEDVEHFIGGLNDFEEWIEREFGQLEISPSLISEETSLSNESTPARSGMCYKMVFIVVALFGCFGIMLTNEEQYGLLGNVAIEIGNKVMSTIQNQITTLTEGDASEAPIAADDDDIDADAPFTTIFAIGDLHGDHDCAVHWITETNLIKGDLRDIATSSTWEWTDPGARLVFVGVRIFMIIAISSHNSMCLRSPPTNFTLLFYFSKH